MSTPLIIAITRVIRVIMSLDHKNNKRKLWVRKWIQRRNELGASNRLIRELSLEDPGTLCNFLRINEDMFNFLLEKVKCR